jgi:choline dehydrogenase-like flavoprotein
LIIEAASDLDPNLLRADICVVGAGAAGIALAREFIGSPVRVCVLESGGLEFDREVQSLCEGEVVGLDYFPLDTTRLRYFGGTTNHWGGLCRPLDPIDFEVRPWVPGSGWPIGPADLEIFNQRAHEVCEIRSSRYDPEWLEERLGASLLELDPSSFVSTVMRYSPPTRFGTTYRPELAMAENVTVILYANVLRFEANEAADAVQSVRFAIRDRSEIQLEAKAYVLAAGGIENPRLLLLSNTVQEQGLGNQHDLVGRYFMEHPHYDIGVIVPESPDIDVTLYDSARWRRHEGIRANAYVAPSADLQRRERLLNALFGLSPSYLTGEEGLTRHALSFLDRIGRYLERRGLIQTPTYRSVFEPDRTVDTLEVMCMLEQTPDPASRVRLSAERDAFNLNRVELDWRIRREDDAALEQTVESLARCVGASGVGRMRIDLRMVETWPGGHHHMGTTRMHSTPSLGVVDANCRVHGISNLYVAGSSVFPTSGASNPTLTIVALAIRLADHLKARLA